MSKIYKKHEILFTDRATKAWEVQYQNFLKHLPVLFPDVKPEQLPEPTFRETEGGEGKILMIVKGATRIEQKVMKGEWKLMHPAEVDKDAILLNKVKGLIEKSDYLMKYVTIKNNEDYVYLYYYPGMGDFALVELNSICESNELAFSLMPNAQFIKIMVFKHKPLN